MLRRSLLFSSRPRGVRLLRGALAAAALAAPLAAAAPADAVALTVQPRGATLTVSGSSHGNVVWPGDSFSVKTSVENGDPAQPTLTGARGDLSSPASGLSLTQASSTFPDLQFGTPTANDTAFAGTLAAAAECGADVPLSLALSANQGSAQLPYSIPTGSVGPKQSYDSTAGTQAIPDNGTLTSVLHVGNTGRVKHLSVRIGNIQHTYDADLRIELVAPDGTSATLVNGQGGSGHNYLGTVFDDGATQSIDGQAAPFTGTYRPEQPLSVFDGKPIQGDWALRVTDQRQQDTGTLVSWGMDASPATCSNNPVASFTANPNPALANQDVNFDARNSVDPGGTITNYAWDLNGDGIYETDTGTTPTLSHAFATRGSHLVGLRLTDDHGHVGTKTLSVSVGNPPVADFSANPSRVDTGQTVTLDASASHSPDAGGSIVKYEWDLDGNGTYERDTQGTPTVSTSYARAGTVNVGLRVTDDTGATSTHTIPLTVNDRAPVASLSTPATVLTGQPATFDAGASSDPDGSVVSYEWDLNGDGLYDTTTTTPQVSHTYSSIGPVTVSVRVTDDSGNTSPAVSQVLNVTSTDRPPVASLSVAPNPARTGQLVTLDASGSSDPDGHVVSYSWDLDGNGTYDATTSSPTFAHAYPNAGPVRVAVRVTDDSGSTAVTSAALQVVTPAPVGGGAGGGSTSGGDTGSGGTTGGGSTGGGSSSGGTPASFVASLVGHPIQKLRIVLRGGVSVLCASNRAAKCSLALQLSARDARTLGLLRRGNRPVVVARALVALAPGRPAAVRLVLTRAARRALPRVRMRTLRVSVTGVVRDLSGHSVGVTRTLLLRR